MLDLFMHLPDQLRYFLIALFFCIALYPIGYALKALCFFPIMGAVWLLSVTFPSERFDAWFSYMKKVMYYL